jgi:hypothetical protein
MDRVSTGNRINFFNYRPELQVAIALSLLHTSQINIGCIRFSHSVTGFISHYIVSASNDISFSLGSSTI